MEESLADSVLESEISNGFSNAPSSSTKWNRSISSSKDSRKDAISSSAATVTLGELIAMELWAEEGFDEWVVWQEKDRLDPRNLA